MKTLISTLTLLATIACSVFLFLLWQQSNSAGTGGKSYSEFEFEGRTQTVLGKEYRAKMVYREPVSTSGNLTDVHMKKIIGRDVFDLSDALTMLAADGWTPVWTDGRKVIVNRPAGHWEHYSYSIEYLPEQP